jgi:hypothetical protein
MGAKVIIIFKSTSNYFIFIAVMQKKPIKLGLLNYCYYFRKSKSFNTSIYEVELCCCG